MIRIKIPPDERVRRVKELVNCTFSGDVGLQVRPVFMRRQYRSKGFSKAGGEEHLEVLTPSPELFDAAVAAIKKEKRRRRASGGKAFEFQVTRLEG